MSVDAADGSVSKIEPIADFVIKTKLLSANGPEKLQDGRKVFINVCHSPLVPKPEVDFNARIVFPLLLLHPATAWTMTRRGRSAMCGIAA